MNNKILFEPIIFLDIDGVLTNTSEIPGSWLTHSPNEYGLSPSNVTALKTLIETTNAKVIITSNWRKFPLDGHWSVRGYTFTSPLRNVIDMLGNTCIGMLPPLRHCIKSEALYYWFDDEHIDYINSKYVIFDDESYEGFATSIFKDHYIQTDPKNGLTTADINNAIKLLV